MIYTDKYEKLVEAVKIFNNLAKHYNQLQLDYVMPIKKIDKELTIENVFERVAILSSQMLEHLEKVRMNISDRFI